MAKMETKVAKIETDVDWIKKENIAQSNKMDSQSVKIDELTTALNNFIKKAPEKFACKETEVKVEKINLAMSKYAGGIIVVLAFLQFISKLIFK